MGAALAAGLPRLAAPVERVPVQPSDPAAMPTFCFARTGSYELEVGGLKLVGSAQRRQGAGFLQHGSVMLGAAPERLRRVFPGTSGPPGRDPLAGMTTLEAVLGRRPGFDETMTALAEGFREVHALELSPGGLAGPESERAETLAGEKYGTERWTRAGRAISARTTPSPGRARGRARALPLRDHRRRGVRRVRRAAGRQRRGRGALGADPGARGVRYDRRVGRHGASRGSPHGRMSGMDLALETRKPSEAKADVLVLGRYAADGRPPAEFAAVDRALGGLLSKVLASEKFEGKPRQLSDGPTGGNVPAAPG